MTPYTLEQFNQLAPRLRQRQLLDCCYCNRWADQLQEFAPFASVEQLQIIAARVWAYLDEGDYLEAFAAHPRIGDLQRLQEKFTSAEQGQVALADASTLEELQRFNRAYFETFGFIFIVCASGKPAREMLAAIKSRIANSRAQEIRNAADEQAKITQLRLGQLFAV